MSHVHCFWGWTSSSIQIKWLSLFVHIQDIVKIPRNIQYKEYLFNILEVSAANRQTQLTYLYLYCQPIQIMWWFTTIPTNLAIWLANFPLLIRVQTTQLTSMCHTMPFSACALKRKHFLWRWYCCKKNKLNVA